MWLDKKPQQLRNKKKISAGTGCHSCTCCRRGICDWPVESATILCARECHVVGPSGVCLDHEKYQNSEYQTNIRRIFRWIILCTFSMYSVSTEVAEGSSYHCTKDSVDLRSILREPTRANESSIPAPNCSVINLFRRFRGSSSISSAFPPRPERSGMCHGRIIWIIL